MMINRLSKAAEANAELLASAELVRTDTAAVVTNIEAEGGVALPEGLSVSDHIESAEAAAEDLNVQQLSIKHSFLVEPRNRICADTGARLTVASAYVSPALGVFLSEAAAKVHTVIGKPLSVPRLMMEYEAWTAEDVVRASPAL